ncbi:uncharacterized protein B0I36DRAFT_357550 [Microdochium trichocladiopsis]|uniref:Uncharacterized protein n=1 Tax=Microdochium trichocladiopsis TaxID=1682393 RepID=A0A9P9BZK5_9PEZI|nr:uncharacterized protein B0I36DRAFT_357550 [Microdochium trichocladiopsis]KAH7040214.1 hypothetical protein B0I36DRAFT_357550 [Microdochium trichocladiopsis]
MEEVAKTIEDTFKPILPREPHTLSPHPTLSYPPTRDPKQLEEQVCRPLQYTTFVSDADRGVLLARAYFDIREEDQASHASNTPIARPADPKKPKTKLSLKDYKSRKEAPDGELTPKPRLTALKEQEQPRTAQETTPKLEMDIKRERDTPATSSRSRPNPQRPRSPSPVRPKKRLSEAADLEPKHIKRQKPDDSIISKTERTLPRPPPAGLPPKPERVVSHDRRPSKDLQRPSPLSNGKRPLNSTPALPSPRTNGVQKPVSSSSSVVKKQEPTAKPKPYVPPLLSPLHLGSLDDKSSSRPSPKKRPDDQLRPLPKKAREERDSSPKKAREERESSPSPKKRRPHPSIPPLLSPTLPPIVMEELAKMKKTASSSSKDSSTGQKPEPQGAVAQKTVHPSRDSIHVDSRNDNDREGRESLVVVLKYKKRLKLTVERILKLEPKGKRFARDRSDSLEPGVAKKRPRAAGEVHATEAGKRPRTSESLQPATPSNRQSAAMVRAASSSSQVGTPGVSTTVTPATQPAESRRPSANPEQVQRLQSRSSRYIELGTKLKHSRDNMARSKQPQSAPSERDGPFIMAYGVQSLLSYMLGFKLENDARDLDKKQRSHATWKSLQPLFRVIKNDCGRNSQISALVLRMQGILLVNLGQALWSYPEGPEMAKELLQNSKDQHETWRMAEKARKALGFYDGSSRSDDGGEVGKLLDRLGPWTSPEEAIPITLEILRKTIRTKEPWRPTEELARYGRTNTNGA